MTSKQQIIEYLRDGHVEATFIVVAALACILINSRGSIQGSGQTSRALKPRKRGQASEESRSTLPALVFIHGLGGSLVQFEPIIKSVGDSATCFGIDFPGCGLSRFEPTRWNAYTQEALTELLRVAILQNLKSNEQHVILIGHSMGCRVAQSLARQSSGRRLDQNGRQWPVVAGVVGICPEANEFPLVKGLINAALLTIPTPIFNVLRAIDKRGGINSASVTRFAGKNAERHTRELQLQFNDQSQTPVFRRMAWGLVRGYTEGASAWAQLDPSIHLLIIGAKDDIITPVSAVERIKSAVEAAGRGRHIRTKILPGSHALPYDSVGSHSVAALVRSFLGEIDERMSASWQLQHDNIGGKWDVKNLAKWQTVMPVSPAIGKPKPVFRALKTLRGIDDMHNPKEFAQWWEQDIKAVIDISQDEPVYDPSLFSPASIEYHKYPTVSKIVPPKEQVDGFIQLVDELRVKNVKAWKGDAQLGRDRTIGVHCHYGFNRTGFFICSYLIERCGYSIEQALEEFQEAKPPGIKHRHFVDELYLQYTSRRAAESTDSDPLSENSEENVRESLLDGSYETHVTTSNIIYEEEPEVQQETIEQTPDIIEEEFEVRPVDEEDAQYESETVTETIEETSEETSEQTSEDTSALESSALFG